MKRFYFNPGISIYLILSISACSSQVEEPVSIDSNRTSYLTVANPSKYVKYSNIKNIISNLNRINSRSISDEIESIEPILSMEYDTTAYVINFRNNAGYVILSANKDQSPILAWSKEGNFSIKEAEAMGSAIWMEEQNEIFSHTEMITETDRNTHHFLWALCDISSSPILQTRSSNSTVSLISQSIAEWENQGYSVYKVSQYKEFPGFSSLPDEAQEILTHLNGVANSNYGGPEEVTYILIGQGEEVTGSGGKELTTEWGQGYPYNLSLPNTSWLLGCTTIAISQILNYHKFPSNYHWEQFPTLLSSNVTSPTPLSAFLYDVSQTIGVRYGTSGTGANIQQCQFAFQSFGYNNVSLISHDARKVDIELNSNRPVFMTGFTDSREGHAWVCDAVYDTESAYRIKIMALEDCPSSIEPTQFLTLYNNEQGAITRSTYYHMNWGWYGNNNGLFLDTSISVRGYNFHVDRLDIINIYPSY